MPGPSAEAINEDVKGLKDDLHKVELAITKEIARVEAGLGKDVAVQGDRLKGLLGWIRLLAVFTFGGIISGVWWASAITNKVGDIEKHGTERFLEINARFDKLEASIAKVLDQTKPAEKARP